MAFGVLVEVVFEGFFFRRGEGDGRRWKLKQVDKLRWVDRLARKGLCC